MEAFRSQEDAESRGPPGESAARTQNGAGKAMSLGDSQKGKESAVNRLATPVITSQEGGPSEHRKGRVGEGENNEEREWSAGQATLPQ